MIEIISGSSYIELKKSINHLDSNSPFLDINFFIALEKSKSIGENTGWISFPIIAKNNNEIIYIDTDSIILNELNQDVKKLIDELELPYKIVDVDYFYLIAKKMINQ